jgi:hypothetical protein
MYPLIKFFAELALLRRGPQDLPVSPVLLLLLAFAGVLVGTINGRDIFGGVREAGGANLLDMVLTMIMLFVLLQFRGRAARWQQTATAFFGLGLLAGLLMLAVRIVADAIGILDIAVLADVLLAVWLHVSLGHVLRNALEIPLMAGVIIVLAYTMMAFNVIVQIFPVATAA